MTARAFPVSRAVQGAAMPRLPLPRFQGLGHHLLQWPCTCQAGRVGFVLVAAVLALWTGGGTALAEPAALRHHDPHTLWPTDDSIVSRARRRGLLRVGFDLFEPWTMCDVDGNLMGHEIDVARKLAEDMGTRIQFVRTEWYFILAALIDERFDVIVSGMSITAGRSVLVNFTALVGESGTVIAANASLTHGRTDFNDPDVTFAARAGTTGAAVVQTHFPKARLLAVGTAGEILQAVLLGEAHAAAVAQITATRWLAAHPDALRRPFERLFNQLPEAIALRKGDLDGLNFFDSWIAQHTSNGWLDERRRYWFETREWEDRLESDPQALAACLESFERGW